MIPHFLFEYRFLSNFWIEPDGTHVEGEYQAAKCKFLVDRSLFIELSPAKAKKLGRRVPIRDDWESVKLDIMYDLVSRKFKDHPDLAAKLLATGDQELVEGNNWRDTFWGVYNGVGENHLGKILMRIRSEMKTPGNLTGKLPVV